ncbi:MAG: AraC family transcriptional regulator [Wenzhouxiangella sp.]|nr:AraC family transcriptional regulator [Wenzhouxiangella sp.]
MNGRLAVVRAKHLIDYLTILRSIGAPVDQSLERSKLPTRIEETPDYFVSVPLALEWIARTGHDVELMELGMLAAKSAGQVSLRPDQQAIIMTAQTGLRRLDALVDLSRLEDSDLVMRLHDESDDIRVTCSMGRLDRHPYICLAEWLNLHSIISVVRSVAGMTWCPREICFVSRARLPANVQSEFPDTRILLGQPSTSIVVEREVLALPTLVQIPSLTEVPASARLGTGQSGGDEFWSVVQLVRSLLQPYLAEGRPDILLIAEISGIGVRTLQRKLRLCGSSYSKILQEARFELACAQLHDPRLKIIEVAMMAGYDSPQHFTRAFRHFTGISPTQYRNLGNP